ncbi:MAG: hypothetical protein ACPGWR_23655 [Ardenticatenaceae bacterium]
MAHTYPAKSGTCPAKSDTYPAKSGTCPAKSETVSLWWSELRGDHFGRLV